MTNEERKMRLVFRICDGLFSLPPDPAQGFLFDEAQEMGSQLDFIQDIGTKGYAEPGYTDPETAIVTGNWNDDKEELVPSELVDPNHEDTEPGEKLTVSKALELLGCEIEWSDEWSMCECGKMVRTQPDSYGWRRSYWDTDNGPVCHECVVADPTDYIEEMVGNDRAAITLDGIDLEQHGFALLEKDLQNGWYGGQKADPRVIGKNLRKKGITRYVFVLDSVGQFDMSFSVWVDKLEVEQAKLEKSETEAAEDPAEVMQRYLRDAGRATAELPPGEGVTVVKPDPDNPGKAVAKRVSGQDFIDGKALD